MMRPTVLTRTGQALVARTQRRQMAGGPFPSGLNVRKNKFVEEWNGRREITEFTFFVTAEKLPTIIFTCILFPFGVYYLTRSEFQSKGHRRYEDLV